LPARDSRAADTREATLRGRPARRAPPAHHRLLARRPRPHRPHRVALRAALGHRRPRRPTLAGSRLQHPRLGPQPHLWRQQRQPLRRACPPRPRRTGLLPGPRHQLRGPRTRRSLPQDRRTGTARAVASLILRGGLPTRPAAPCQPLRPMTRWAPLQTQLRLQPRRRCPPRRRWLRKCPPRRRWLRKCPPRRRWLRMRQSIFRLPNRDLPLLNLYDRVTRSSSARVYLRDRGRRS
jgi:hypothetical protein